MCKEGTFTSLTLTLSFLRSFGVATAISNEESMSSYMYVHGTYLNVLRLRRRYRIPHTPNEFLLTCDHSKIMHLEVKPSPSAMSSRGTGVSCG